MSFRRRPAEAAQHTSKVHEANIDAIIRLEAEQEERVSHTDRLSEAIGQFAGTTTFVVLQIVWVSVWISMNGGLLESMPKFDPFPFPLLSMILALEAVLLTGFVLIRQNRMGAKADQRSHLDLQINLLAEKEATKVIQLLQRLKHPHLVHYAGHKRTGKVNLRWKRRRRSFHGV